MGGVSMPLICDKTDQWVVVEFDPEKPAGTFDAYLTATGYRILAQAQAAAEAAEEEQGVTTMIYKLEEQEDNDEE